MKSVNCIHILVCKNSGLHFFSMYILILENSWMIIKDYYCRFITLVIVILCKYFWRFTKKHVMLCISGVYLQGNWKKSSECWIMSFLTKGNITICCLNKNKYSNNSFNVHGIQYYCISYHMPHHLHYILFL